MEKSVETSFKSNPSPEGGISATCPFCGRGHTLDSPGSMPPGRRLIFLCKCGQEFEVRLEDRRYGREKVQLVGEYTNMTSGGSGPMIIEDLSMEGIGFRVTEMGDFDVGDLLVLAFELNDYDKTRTRAKVAVRQKHGPIVGCEILEILEGGANYGLYLLP